MAYPLVASRIYRPAGKMISIEVDGHHSVGHGVFQGYRRRWRGGPRGVQIPPAPLGTEPDGIGDGPDGDLRCPFLGTMVKLRRTRQPVSPTRLVCEMAQRSGQDEVNLPRRIDPDGRVAPACIRLAVRLKEPPVRFPALPPFGFVELRGFQVVAGVE